MAPPPDMFLPQVLQIDRCYSYYGLVHYHILERTVRMTSKIKLLQIIVLISIAISTCIITGCTSSRLTDVWKDPSFGSQSLKHVLVIAPRNNPVHRRLWEDALVSGLAAQGVEASPAYKVFGDSIPTPDQVGASVKENNFDGVVMVRKLETKILTRYVQGTVKEETTQRYNRLTQSYENVLREVRQPGYIDTNRVVRNEVNVFASAGDNGVLVWAGTGETIDPSSRDAVKNEIADLVIPELAK
jgi:hypothetical protein